MALWPWEVALQQQQLRRFAQERGHTIRELPMAASPALGCSFWEWLAEVSTTSEPAVLSTPLLEARELTALAQVPEAAATPLGVTLQPLPEAAGADRGLLAQLDSDALPATQPATQAPADADAGAAEAHSRAWVRRALAASPGLALCPYTANDDLAGVKLEALGVNPAPIMHETSTAHGTAALLADVWRSIDRMVAGGEDAYSSIVLSAPAFDDRERPRPNSNRFPPPPWLTYRCDASAAAHETACPRGAIP